MSDKIRENSLSYHGFEVAEKDGDLEIKGVSDFDPLHVFECGQCFRWKHQSDGSYTGVVMGRLVRVVYCKSNSGSEIYSSNEGTLTISNSSFNDFKDRWFDYFDLGTDYSKIKKLVAKDEIMKKAVAFGHGIRLLRQEPWETLISFIISSNNKIPRIMSIITNISENYGETIDGHQYAFPLPEKLAALAEDGLKACSKGGYRCKYMIATAQQIINGNVKLENLYDMSTDEARKTLTDLPGVGSKVADCILLYSGIKFDVFPTDVWIKRVMEELYFKREASMKEIREFSASYFGELAGFAQQYLFYYARENRIGTH